MRRLLELYDDLYGELDRAAIAYDDGVHAKHRLTRYYDFFVDRIQAGERVLDIGCGKGELALDIAERAGATVVGIDHNPAHLEFARSRSSHARVTYAAGDVLRELPPGHFDVVVLSNVLEHFEHRVQLLHRLTASASPGRVLVRVPVRERHWTIPLREELGLQHFSDPTHHIEYEPGAFRRELASAGLEVTELLVTWGEIWATARPEGDAARDVPRTPPVGV
jgi:2-polyprenyl-3-methyl-5-hydroxy-6-metoxy-1,4-benzoquinol methylase